MCELGLSISGFVKGNLTKFVRLCSKATVMRSVDTAIGFITRHHVVHPTIFACLYFNFFIYFYWNISQICKTNTFGTAKDFLFSFKSAGRWQIFKFLFYSSEYT